MKVKLYTLGCKVNQYETQEITESLIKNGFEITNEDEKADIYIVNSCTVTAESDRKTRQLVRHFKRLNSEGIVVLTGCMPQAFPDIADKLSQADIVIGNKNNDTIVERINEFIKNNKRIVNINQHKTGEKFCGSSICSFNERTRAIVKIEDGCDRFCSYCIIPFSRGRVRSKPLAEITSEVGALAKNGFCEIVLVGINLSSYGKDNGEKFYNAVKAACDVKGIKRVRLGSLEPDHITDEVIENLSKLPKLCPQFHISLQSGSNNVLKKMNRHYSAEEYFELCTKLRKSFKDCTITTDIMVGFSGETQEDFNETLEFVKKVRFEKVHVFPYSIRKGTRAENFDGQIEKSVKENRAAQLRELCTLIRKDFLKTNIGKTVEVLVESKTNGEYTFGYTNNYTPVRIKTGEYEVGNTFKVEIIESDDDFCYSK